MSSSLGDRIEEELTDYGALLRWRARHQPDRLAYVQLENGERESIRYNYAGFDLRVRSIAAVLQRHGAKGGRVLLVLASDIQFTAAFFSCLYAGATAVTTLAPSTPEQFRRLAFVMKDAESHLILATRETIHRMAERVGDFKAFQGAVWIAIDEISPSEADQWTEQGASWDEIGLLQYTSGSTTSPRGVMVTHRNLARAGQNHEELGCFTGDDLSVTWLPQSHDMGLIFGVLQPCYSGHPCVVMSPTAFLKKPMRWIRAVSSYGATVSCGPNFAYALCVEAVREQDFQRLDLSRFDCAFNGGEPIRAKTLEEFAATFHRAGFRRESFCGSYGMAETTLAVTGTPRGKQCTVLRLAAVAMEQGRAIQAADGEIFRKVVSCGPAGPGIKVRIVASETLAVLPCEEIGEILISGGIVAQGYWRKSESTKTNFEVFTADGQGPFLRTGDLGFVDRDGDVYITGRRKDLIIVNGRNHAPQDIELTVETAHPAIRPLQTAAVAVDQSQTEMVVIIAELAKQHTQDVVPEEVGWQVARKVALEHQVPVLEVVFVKRGECPKTTSGKVQRQRAKKLYEEGGFTVMGRFRNPAFANS